MSQTVADAPRFRLQHIDALRGMAALYVLIYHTALIPAPPLDLPQWSRWFVLGGGTGVTLFFVVSAFTLCISMHTRADEPKAIEGYFVRRVFRIVPLFYVWVALTIVRDWYLFGVVHPPWRISLTLSFAYNFFPGEEISIVWAGWTLGVEMVFYLIFPLINRYAMNVWRGLAFLILTIIVAVLYRHVVAGWTIPEANRTQFIQFSFLSKLPAFACGVLAYHVFLRLVSGRPQRKLLSIVLVVSGALLYWGAFRGVPGLFVPGLVFHAIAYSLLLLGLSVAEWPLLVNRATVFLGVISYSIYLSHPTVVYLLTPLYRWIYTWPAPTTIQFAMSTAITLAVSLVVSTASYRWIEQPGMRLGSRLTRRAPPPHVLSVT